jgi:RimJ/RimL family protein N-acetyltransferase
MPAWGFFSLKLRVTTDADEIRRYFTADDVWEWVSDDSSDLDQYQPPICEQITYYIPEQDGVPVGCLMLVECNHATVELHSALLPQYRGKATALVFRALLDALARSKYAWLRTWVADCNRAAFVAAKRVGFDHIGTEKMAYRKGGQLYDNHLFGVAICPQQ